jgi:hypothetical protein
LLKPLAIEAQNRQNIAYAEIVGIMGPLGKFVLASSAEGKGL